MATTLIESAHPGGFLISEWDSDFSREQVTIFQGTAGVRVASLAAQITSPGAGYGEYANYTPGNSNGLQTLVGIFYDTYLGASPVIGTAPGKGVIVVRDAVVNADELDWNGLTNAQITTAIASLKSLGIIPRDGV